jgi:hypothetical protein
VGCGRPGAVASVAPGGGSEGALRGSGSIAPYLWLAATYPPAEVPCAPAQINAPYVTSLGLSPGTYTPPGGAYMDGDLDGMFDLHHDSYLSFIPGSGWNHSCTGWFSFVGGSNELQFGVNADNFASHGANLIDNVTIEYL